MGVCYVAIPPPPAAPEAPHRPVNINYVYGFSNDGPQTWLPADWYFALLVAVMPLVVYLPSHLLFGWLFTKREGDLAEAWASST
jgi:hypothetical protein